MAVDGGSGGSGGKKPGRRRRDDEVVVHNPVAPASTTNLGSGTAAASTTSGGGTKPAGTKVLGGKGGTAAGTKGGSSSSSSSSSASSSYLAAQRKTQAAARDRYIEDAERLGGQVTALQAALGGDGAFRRALTTKLGNLDQVLSQQMDALNTGFGERWGSLKEDERNNSIALADSSTSNDTNRARERSSALAEIASQGAGESDGLRAQLMSLRSWDANQDGINRAYADGARSIQNSRIDLVSDTRTAMQNVWLEADADRAQLWNDFHGQQSETWTALGNALGQQAEYYGMAKEQGRGAGSGGGGGSRSSSSSSTKGGKKGGKGSAQFGQTGFAQPGFEQDGDRERSVTGRPQILGRGAEFSTEAKDAGKNRGRPVGGKGRGGRGSWSGLGQPAAGDAGGSLRDRMEAAEAASDAAFIKSANQMGKAYDSEGLPRNLQNWGPAVPETVLPANAAFANARTTIAQKRPEGATLRSW